MQNKSFTLNFVQILTPFILLATPLFFLPLTANFFSTPQQILLTIVSLIFLTILSIEILFKRTIPISSSPLRLPLIIFILIVVLNLLLNPEGRTEALAGTGSLFIVLATISYFLTLFTPTHKFKFWIAISIVASATILSIHGILQLTILHSWSILPLFMQDRGFTPTGSPLITTTLILVGVVVSFILSLNETKSIQKYSFIGLGLLGTIAAMAYISLMLPGSILSPVILPFIASWNIALDAAKNTHNLIFGVGFANFPLLFTSVKPLFLNATNFWNILPTSASSELFQWFTTSGILGLVSFFYLIYTGFIKIQFSNLKNDPIIAIFLCSILALFLLPGSIPIYLLFFTSLGILGSQTSHEISVNNGLNFLLSSLILILVATGGYYLVLITRTELLLGKAKVALSQNDGKTVYDSNLQMIQLIPTMANYRLSYSQVNFSLASALSQKSELSDEEKQNISQLVAQSIREGKAATTLRPHDAKNWQNLGNIYSKLLTVAEGSDQFAISSYSQAIALDPSNPTLHNEFGLLLMQLRKISKIETDKTQYLNRAGAEFQTASQLKQNLPNSQYNLAKVYEESGNFTDAYAIMKSAVGLMSDDNPEKSQINSELETLKSKVPQPTPSPSSTPQI